MRVIPAECRFPALAGRAGRVISGGAACDAGRAFCAAAFPEPESVAICRAPFGVHQGREEGMTRSQRSRQLTALVSAASLAARSCRRNCSPIPRHNGAAEGLACWPEVDTPTLSGTCPRRGTHHLGQPESITGNFRPSKSLRNVCPRKSKGGSTEIGAAGPMDPCM
jgi:hypothetical protein